MDGDAKINMSEFALGMKSSLKVFAKKGATKRPNSSAVSGFAQKLVTTTTPSKAGYRQGGTPRSNNATTPRNAGRSNERL